LHNLNNKFKNNIPYREKMAKKEIKLTKKQIDQIEEKVKQTIKIF